MKAQLKQFMKEKLIEINKDQDEADVPFNGNFSDAYYGFECDESVYNGRKISCINSTENLVFTSNKNIARESYLIPSKCKFHYGEQVFTNGKYPTPGKVIYHYNLERDELEVLRDVDDCFKNENLDVKKFGEHPIHVCGTEKYFEDFL